MVWLNSGQRIYLCALKEPCQFVRMMVMALWYAIVSEILQMTLALFAMEMILTMISG